MKCWKSCVLLLVGVAMLTACSSGGGSDDNSGTTASSDPTVFYTHTAIFKNHTAVYTWGGNESGQLGINSYDYKNVPVRSLVRFVDYTGVGGVSVGSNHTLAFQKYRTVRAWGFNRYGQLGNGFNSNGQTPNSPVPVIVRKKGLNEPLSGVVGVAAGGYHSLAVDSDGKVWSWGNFSNGQLGRGVINNTFVNFSSQVADSIPIPVNGSPFSSITAIAAGGSHSLALDSNGTVWSWGYNGYGQLGNATTLGMNGYYPTVLSLQNITKIAAGGSHSLALDTSGNVWSWGYNHFGQLGDGTTTDKSTPVKVKTPSSTDLAGITMIAAGLSHSLAYDATSEKLYVWGMNRYGQLGKDPSSSSQLPETRTPYEPYAVEIPNFSLKAVTGSLPETLTAAGYHSHAMKTDGSWWSWGNNSSGQLGNGTTTDSWSPVRVIGF